MKRVTLISHFFPLHLTYSVSAASLQSMSKKQVQQAFINKTLISIPTDNLNGKTIHNTFTMFLDDKGVIYGKMKAQISFTFKCTSLEANLATISNSPPMASI